MPTALPRDSVSSAHANDIPGRIDIWIFVAIEALVFSSYFVAYMLYRAWNPEMFLQSQAQLSQNFGVANTLILLLSSWLMARGVHAARERRFDLAEKLVWMTLSCGLLFVASKLLEWSLKIRAGFELSTNTFFAFYYFLTGIHVVHVLIGSGFLGVVIHQLRGPSRRSVPVIETGGVYWHMVDFLWVIIFALLYVMR